MYKVICFDLDDTLYKEVDYLKSAYKEIASYAAGRCGADSTLEIELAKKGFLVMLEAFREGGNAFSELNEYLGLDLPVKDYLAIYRQHVPNLQLSDEVTHVLSELKKDGCVLGLITDGRSVQQRHKIEALGLECYFSNENIIISEEFGSEKPSEANYRYFMEHYPQSTQFVYVGDNPLKDFITPNMLGWKTICLLDDGRNIHPQDFSGLDKNQPNVKVHSLKELLYFVV